MRSVLKALMRLIGPRCRAAVAARFTVDRMGRPVTFALYDRLLGQVIRPSPEPQTRPIRRFAQRAGAQIPA